MRVATFHHHIVSTQNSAWHINKYYVNELVLIVDILPFWNGLHLKPIKLASSKVYLKWMGSCDRHGGTPPRNTFRKGMWHQLLGMMSVGGQLLQELLQLQGSPAPKSILPGVDHIHWHIKTQPFHPNADQLQRTILAPEQGWGPQKLSSGLTHIATYPCAPSASSPPFHRSWSQNTPRWTTCTLPSISASQCTSLGTQPVSPCMHTRSKNTTFWIYPLEL